MSDNWFVIFYPHLSLIIPKTMQICNRSTPTNLLYNSDMNTKIFVTLVFLLFLTNSKSTPYSPHANPNCTTPFCTTCAVPANCTMCDGEYYLEANACATCTSAVTNCVNCTYNSGTTLVDCTLCDVGYYPDTLQSCRFCNLDVPLCLTCINDGTTTTCKVCEKGYFLSAPNNCTACNANIPDCAQCDPIPTAPFEVCNLCITNYIVDDIGACVACDIYKSQCQTCNQVAKTCDICNDGYYRKNSGTDCSPCTDSISNCALCAALDDAGTSVTCNKCQNDTYPVGNTSCLTCGNYIIGCIVCNPVSNTCDTCSIGRFRFGSGASCKLCITPIPSCATCNATDDAGLNVTCSKCQTDTFLKANACVTCDLFITSCTACNNIDSTCETCALGNFRDAKGALCSTCDSRITGCSNCIANDDAATTITCSGCAAGLYLLNNECVTCDLFITGCTFCNDVNSTCDTCALGDYRKDQGKACDTCGNAVTNCAECNALDDNGTNVACTKCAPNTITVGNTCEACATFIKFCDTCNIVTSTCTTCSAGYYRKTSGQTCNLCTEFVPFCSVCVAIDDAGSNITCSACSPNTFLVGQVCKACGMFITDCKTCATQTNCTDCVDKFYPTLLGDSCKPCSEVASCVACSNNGKDAASCSACSDNLVVNKDNVCVGCGDIITDCNLCVQNSTTLELTCNGCGNGKVLADDKLSCQDSSSSTIIIVSAVVGGVVLLGAGFAIFKCMKKRKSPLLEEDYEKI